MSQSLDLVLIDMLEAITGIEKALEERSFDDFGSDWLLKHGVQRGIEIISEASRRIPASMKARHANVPWQDGAGIGSILRHEYHRVSDRAIWNTATRDLAPVKKAVSLMLQSLGCADSL